MKRISRKLRLILICIVLASMLSACGGSKLVGMWVSDDSEVLVFKDDNTGYMDGFGFTWYTEGKTLTISSYFIEMEYRYSIIGNKLTLREIYSDGTVDDDAGVFIKKGSSAINIGDTSTMILAIVALAIVLFILRLLSKKKTKRPEKGETGNILDTKTEITDVTPAPVIGEQPKPVQRPRQAPTSRPIPRPDTSKEPRTEGKHVARPVVKTSEPTHIPQNSDLGMNKLTSCPACGASLSADSAFCHKCGSRLADLIVKHESVCTVCGSLLPEDAVFCPNCGKKKES